VRLRLRASVFPRRLPDATRTVRSRVANSRVVLGVLSPRALARVRPPARPCRRSLEPPRARALLSLKAAPCTLLQPPCDATAPSARQLGSYSQTATPPRQSSRACPTCNQLRSLWGSPCTGTAAPQAVARRRVLFPEPVPLLHSVGAATLEGRGWHQDTRAGSQLEDRRHEDSAASERSTPGAACGICLLVGYHTVWVSVTVGDVGALAFGVHSRGRRHV
jgi:hypothetical protein